MILTPTERARRIDRLRKLADKLEHDATLMENGDNTADGGKHASDLKRDAFAVTWALEQVFKLDAKGE